MSFDQILDAFHNLYEKRSHLLKKIQNSKDEITSISERIKELSSFSESQKKTQDFIDQLSKSKSKLKHIRQEIAEDEHNVRLYEAKIQICNLQFQILLKGRQNCS